MLVTMLGAAIFVVTPVPDDLLKWLSRYERNAVVKTVEEPRPNSFPKKIGFALPSTYGVYALSNNKLLDLHTLPIRIPDPRIAISGIFSQPSATTLPDSHPQFIVFQRGLINNAPDRTVVRVVAQVMRAVTFVGGKAKTTAVQNSWAVRPKTYEMRIGPVDGNPDMVMIRSENPDIPLPAGRYALVIGNIAYDFTVGGPITDPAHCLERTDALNTPVYNECRMP